MNKKEKLLDIYPDVEFRFATGLDDALIGVAYDKKTSVFRLVYSQTKVIEILMERDKMSFEEAIEFYEFNIEDAYIGDDTPVWVDDQIFKQI